MAVYEDECIAIDLPEKWEIKQEDTGVSIVPGRGRLIAISFTYSGHGKPAAAYDHFHQCFTGTPSKSAQKAGWQTEVIEPFEAGAFVGFSSFAELPQKKMSQLNACFLQEDFVLMVLAHNAKSSEMATFWEAFGGMILKPGIPESIEKRYEMPVQTEYEMDARDLSKPRTKKFKTWMDHQMVLLMDSESHPGEDNPFVNCDTIQLVMPCNDKALWVTSQTEWDVTLEFVVRDAMPQTRKVWWQREAEAVLSIPSGHLHVDETTGGLLMDIVLPIGDYRVTARASCPPDADGGSEGVEKIQVIIVPDRRP